MSLFLVRTGDQIFLPPCAGLSWTRGAITSMDYTAGALKELDSDLERYGVALVFAHISESLKAILDRQGLTQVIGPNQQFETLRECLAAYQA